MYYTDGGLSEVLGALLLIGIITTGTTIFLAIYLPQIETQPRVSVHLTTCCESSIAGPHEAASINCVESLFYPCEEVDSNGPYIVVCHEGGDSLKSEYLSLIINDQKLMPSITGDTPELFSVGERLYVNMKTWGITPPFKVIMVYEPPDGIGVVLVDWMIPVCTPLHPIACCKY